RISFDLIVFLIFLFLCQNTFVSAQEKSDVGNSDSLVLINQFDHFFANAIACKHLDPIAIISPVDELKYAGQVSASAFNQLNSQKHYKNIFIISHYSGSDQEGFILDTSLNLSTEFGVVPVNKRLTKNMLYNSDIFSQNPQAHHQDTSIEYLCRFLQYKLQKPINVIPVLCGKPSTKSSKQLAMILQNFLTDENLFVIGTNFSENISYEEATYVDKVMLMPILKNSPGGFISSYKNFMTNRRFPWLKTVANGWGSLMSLLYMTEKDSKIKYHPILYQNSGGIELGNELHVTGYHAIAIAKLMEAKKVELTIKDKKFLIKLCRQSIKDYVLFNTVRPVDESEISESLKTTSGAFVNLKKHGNDRALGGWFNEGTEMYIQVQQAVIEAAKNRNSVPVTQSELDQIEIEISIPTALRRINSIHEIEIGVHGVFIRKGNYSGFYLPHVSLEKAWNVIEYLSFCAQNKVGISPSEWQDAEIYIFETMRFSEKSLYDVY
ncbi:MAG: AmmeMemoRadiSam system protein B, partial [Bacteroidota bacterium]|nr:AmmeMemoRadiSam system protein B [Bacteroidota bacterium]